MGASISHTPGPWTVERDDEMARLYVRLVPDRGMYPSQRAPIEIDIDFDDVAAVNEAEANARLIAAAPAMYDALQFFVDCEDSADLKDGLRAARAALALARGEGVEA